MILPAGSPLVQFEIDNFAHGGRITGGSLPVAVWVDRSPGEKCVNGKSLFRIRNIDGGIIAKPKKEGYCPSVCLCMGRFIE